LEFCALASGSSGNCFYVKKGGTAVLVDCGISAKQVTERLDSIGESIDKIRGIFVTHEHTDHIRGVDVLASRHEIPVFLTKKTADAALICREKGLIHTIKNDELVNVNGIHVQAFSKSHDAFDPVSYCLEAGGKRLGVITDIGYACKNVVSNISQCDSLILESNHDINMLKNGGYPAYLKKRIASKYGHISNYEAALLVLSCGSKRLQSILLSHLSQNNNTPELALRAFGLLNERKDIDPDVFVSCKEKASDLVRIR
jgi:phosphoribosyl 1,2-cyclic phosphodiesterase